MILTVEQLRKQIDQLLHSAHGELDSFQESFLIVEHVLHKTKSQIIVDAESIIDSQQIERAMKLAEQRLSGVPWAYLVGYKDFFKSRFSVGSGVLIPRPETEMIVEEALKIPNIISIADLGSGSGCIGISILLERPEARLWTCDVSSVAVQFTKQNATQLGVSDKINSVFGSVELFKFNSEFDLIVSNPPYIAEDDVRVETNVRKYEPAQALYAENSGLSCFKKWFPWSFCALKNNGTMIFEFGQGQSKDVYNIAVSAGFSEVKILKDIAGIERVVVAKKVFSVKG